MSLEQVKHGIGRANGSCGELVQGIKLNGEPYHITLPINLYTTVNAYIIAQQNNTVTINAIGVGPTTTIKDSKMAASAKLACHLLGKSNINITLTYETDLSVKKRNRIFHSRHHSNSTRNSKRIRHMVN